MTRRPTLSGSAKRDRSGPPPAAPVAPVLTTFDVAAWLATAPVVVFVEEDGTE